jgi:hypothetical protein
MKLQISVMIDEISTEDKLNHFKIMSPKMILVAHNFTGPTNRAFAYEF